MRYLILGLIVFISVSAMIASSMEHENKVYINYSESNCVGETCTNYLLSQMNNKSFNLSIQQKPEICEFANWDVCS